MKKRFSQNVSLILAALALLGLWFSILYGCNPGTSPKSPSAVHFKQEVQGAFLKLSPPLVDPISRGEKANVLLIIEQWCKESLHARYFQECRISVLDGRGVMIVSRPATTADGMNYSRYEAVREAYRKKRKVHLVNYLQDGSRWYSIATPLLKKGKMVGLLSLSYDSRELHRIYGLTDQEFLALDFNS